MKILKGLFLLFCISASVFCQDFWMPTSNLSGSDWVLAIQADLRGSVIASSWQAGIYRTTNNGTNWTPSGLTGKSVFCITEGPDSALFAVTTSNSGATIYLSSDDGLSWSNVYFAQHTNNFFYGGGITFMNNNIVVAALSFTLGPTLGDIGVDIVRSTDAGRNWQHVETIGSWGGTQCLAKLNDGRILAATDLAGLWYSTNNGSNWLQVTGFPAIYANFIKVNSNGDIFVSRNTAAGSTDLVFRSTDNGATWQGTGLLGGTGGGDVKAMHIDTQNRIYVSVYTFGPTVKKIYRSTDNGATWNELQSGMPVSQLVYSLTGNSQDVIFAGTQSSGVYKGSDNTTGITINTQPVSFSLEQNYPNPFNPVTEIKYGIPRAEFVSIKVFDMSGKTVSVLVNGFKRAGEYEISFNALSLSSGIYFYRMESSGYTVTKKMILVK